MPVLANRRRATLRKLCLALLVPVLAAVSTTSSVAATAGTTVTLDVRSSISLTNGCQDPAGYSLGNVLPGSASLTATGAGVCSMSFQSNNDSAMLRIGQRDGGSTAMGAASSTWSSGRTAGATHYNWGVTAYDSSLVMAVGNYGRIRRSTDGGATWPDVWQPPTTGFTTSLLDIERVPGDSTTWYAVGVDRTVLKMTSATTSPAFTSAVGDLGSGATVWPSDVDVSSLIVLDGTTLVIVGDSGWMAKSTNGGANWTKYQVGTTNHTSIDALDATTYYVSGRSGWISYTTTGGGAASDWTRLSIGSNNHLTGIAIADASHMYAVGNLGRIYVCTASPCTTATNWIERTNRRHVAQNITDVASSPSMPSAAFAVSRDGIVLKTTDSGATWTRPATHSASQLEAVTMAPTGNLVVAVGTEKTIIRSSDLSTFARVSNERPVLTGSAVDPVDGRNALLVGDAGAILRTTDSGSTWNSMPNSDIEPLFAVDYGSGSVAWAVGESGRVLKSADAGGTWSVQTTPASVRLWDVAAIDAYTAYAVGDAGTVLKTTNGGSSWSSSGAFTVDDTLRTVEAPAADLVVVGGLDGLVRRSTDGGQTFVAATTPPTSDVIDLTMADKVTGYAVSTWTNVWKTTDGGATWSKVNENLKENVEVSAASPTVVFVATTSGGRVSRDGGVTWSTFTIAGPMATVAAADANTAYGGGHFGAYGSTTPSGAVNTTVSDYGAADATWSGTVSAFGVCLQAAGAGTTVNGPTWVADSSSECTASDSDPWYAVPAAVTKLASTSTAGTLGTVDLVWGFRPSQSQAPGNYTATVIFEALAPSV